MFRYSELSYASTGDRLFDCTSTSDKFYHPTVQYLCLNKRYTLRPIGNGTSGRFSWTNIREYFLQQHAISSYFFRLPMQSGQNWSCGKEYKVMNILVTKLSVTLRNTSWRLKKCRWSKFFYFLSLLNPFRQLRTKCGKTVDRDVNKRYCACPKSKFRMLLF